MAEIVTKIAISLFMLVLIYWQLIFLHGVWQSQIDPKETISRLFKRLSPQTEVIARRDPNAIYQNGTKVGEVTGEVEKNDVIIFRQLSETSSLNRDLPFEYRRETVEIIKVGTVIGQKSVGSGRKVELKTAVLEDVVCKKLR